MSLVLKLGQLEVDHKLGQVDPDPIYYRHVTSMMPYLNSKDLHSVALGVQLVFDVSMIFSKMHDY